MSTEEGVAYLCFIQHDDDEKYIIAEIATQNAKMRKIALVSTARAYHKEIVREFEMQLAATGERLKTVHGGGILKINSKKRKIKTYGQSAGYGPPNRELVEEILRHNFPDWTLDVTVTDYIRG